MPAPKLKPRRARAFLLGGSMVLLLVTLGVAILSGDGAPVAGEISMLGTEASGPADVGQLDDVAEVDGERERASAGADGGREVLGVPSARKVRFSGRAEDRISLEGIVGATVKVRVGEDTVIGVTSEGGGFSVEVPLGVRLDVEASAENYLPARRSGVRAEKDVVLRLDRSSSLAGLVVGPGEEEMEETEVHVRADDRREERVIVLEPDERGAFEVPGLEPGEFNVSVWAPGWSFGVERDIIVRPGKETYLVFELDRAGSASARVVLEGTTTGIEGVEVQIDPWVQGLNRDVEDQVSLEFITDESGRVELDSLNPGENRVRLHSSWGDIVYAPRLVVESAEHQHLVWTMTAPAVCAGVLIGASGDPTAGTVWVTPTPDRWGRTGAVSEEWQGRGEGAQGYEVGPDGRFRFEELPTSTSLRFHGTSRGDAPELGSLDRKLAPGSEVLDMELRLTRMVTITGQVLDPDEQPAEGATLSTWGMQRVSEAPVETDAEGRFSLDGQLQRRCGIIVRHEAFKTHYENVGSREPEGPLVIRLSEPDGVHGRVVNENGDAVPWARVTAAREGDRRRNESSGADEFGRFRFDSMREGTWNFYASASGYERLESVQVRVPHEGELTLPMRHVHTPDPATIRGLAMLPDGTAPSRLRVERLRSAAMAVDGGDFRIYGLSPGDHYLVLEAAGCAPRSLGKIVLLEAEERDVGLVHMYPGIEVDVRVSAKAEHGEDSGPSLSDARVRMAPVGGYAEVAGGGTRKPQRVRRGTYSMGTLELGTWNLDVRRSGHKAWKGEVVLTEGRSRRFEIELERQE